MSFATPTPRQATFELIFAGALWGFGFVAAQWALTTWNPAGVLIWRFAGAMVIGEILYLIINLNNKNKHDWKSDFKGSIPAGLMLGTFLLLQTIGLQYTTASKSGFITTLYVIFVPLVNWVVFKKKISSAMLALIALACGGTFLLMDIRPQNFADDVNVGDLWTLAGAFVGAMHIIYIGRFTQKIKNPFRVNNFQSLFAIVAVLPMVFFAPKIQIGDINAKALWGLLVLAGACSLLGFYIQVRAQKVLSDSTASILFLLESPYAFFFAYLLAGERLNGPQGFGAILILGAALGMVVLENGPTSKERSK